MSEILYFFGTMSSKSHMYLHLQRIAIQTSHVLEWPLVATGHCTRQGSSEACSLVQLEDVPVLSNHLSV